MKTLTKEHNLRKIFLFLIMPLLVLGLAIVGSLFIFNIYKQHSSKEIILVPDKVININEPFSGNFHFNDELNHQDFSSLIISGLDSAKNNIELAMYSIDSPDIIDALYRAANRGVSVNLILSTKHEAAERSFFSRQNDHLNVIFVGGSESEYMHHKFLIIDRNEKKQTVFFSSYNFTYIQERYDPSFMLESDRPELVSLFGDEFDRLSNKESFEFKRTDNYNPYAALINYSDGYLEVWFTPSSPEKNIKLRMLSLIKGASNNIKVLIWFLTDKDIASALLLKAREIPVSIIADDFNFNVPGSAFPIMTSQKNRQKLDNLEILTDAKRSEEMSNFSKDSSLNSFLHQHSLIIDDKIVLFGTNNWSSGGFFSNDESVMVSNIPSVVSAFRTSFLYNHNVNK